MRLQPRSLLLIALGAASWFCYLAALGLVDLRTNTVSFVVLAMLAFGLYLGAAAVVLQPASVGSGRTSSLGIIIFFAVLFRLTLLVSRPTLSDDMFRYVWDGRVQASGLSPYRYPPRAAEVVQLHRYDTTIWPNINRKEVVTVYPPGAEIIYALLWRVVGDSVTGYKVAFTLAEFMGAFILMRLLQHFGRPPEQVLLYLWSPLLVFEIAQAGHVDGLVLPFLIAAFYARAKEKYWLLGLCLGAAAMIKLFPVILIAALLPLAPLPELWRDPRRLKPAVKTLLAFTALIVACYAVYLFRPGQAIGFLPQYLNENFNLGLARPLFDLAEALTWPKSTLVNIVTFGGVAVIGLACLLKPAASARSALARCVWLIGWYTLFTQNLFSWYLLWLLPLITLFIEPGRFLGFRLSSATAWLIFSGTILLSYLFFIQWRVIALAQWAEYLPLYVLLGLAWGLKLLPTLRPIPVPTTQDSSA